jgi:hypothetical protein
LRSLGGGPPSQPKPQPGTSATTVAVRFAKALASYSGPGKRRSAAAAYQAYLSALGADVAGHNPAVVSQLTGMHGAPSRSLRSRARVGQITVVRSARSTVTLYLIVTQTVMTTSNVTEVSPCPPPSTAPKGCPSRKARTTTSHVTTTTPRTLQIYLVLTRHQGQGWLVSAGHTSLIDHIAAVGGVLSPVIAPAPKHQAVPASNTASPSSSASSASPGPQATGG